MATVDPEMNPESTPSKHEQKVEDLNRELQLRNLRDEIFQHRLIRWIRGGLVVSMAIFLFILTGLLANETAVDLYKVQALGLRILGALLIIGILMAAYYHLSLNNDD